MPFCPTCGQGNPEVARYCFACATPLAAVPPPRDERKVVTVVFADLVGFTSHADGMDPEDVQALLAPYHARLRAELERFGGTVEKFIGDAVMALFGAPVAREGDPERAVRAALVDSRLGAKGARAPGAHRGEHGRGVVSIAADSSAGETMAAGDVLNTASRLQTAAPDNGVIVGEQTYWATRSVIAYREAEPVVAKGKSSPVAVWEAVGARADLRGARLHRTPFVGRSARAGVARVGARRCSELRSARRATLIAGPGQGKSRLVHEFRARRRGGRLARGALRALRHGRDLLGARRDRQGARGDPRGGAGGDSGREARGRGARSASRRPRGGVGGGPPPHTRRPRERERLVARPALGGVLRVAALPRGAGRCASTRARLRRPALGRRRSARLHRPRARVGERRAVAHHLHGATRVARAPGRLGSEPAEQPAASPRGAARRRRRADRVGAARQLVLLPETRRPCSSGPVGIRSMPSSTRASSSSAGRSPNCSRSRCKG